ncbi:hypothetical protein ACFLUK_03185 [Chloroflexota bacterium]
MLLTHTMQLAPEGISRERVMVLSTVYYGGSFGTAPELLFKKKELITVLQQLLRSYARPAKSL